ncbi:uncharacterized protein PADG_04070 [Paracoccidioides brasiliensis Pb18]|uniref:AAA+ ATPase domain-containing protein n=1 Tax=Paracoccidioides brasiliensis (strain Pb18) TaxID=502780 RepID=C1G9Y4_PARBD|nr:uncharacterized protein PADG_04070 [Paracoccidioides brasiliensis Pb18]EEH47986.1 hypothetical protein PADG_04070 [Paracoccidioides brasiliensis Pb18]
MTLATNPALVDSLDPPHTDAGADHNGILSPPASASESGKNNTADLPTTSENCGPATPDNVVKELLKTLVAGQNELISIQKAKGGDYDQGAATQPSNGPRDEEDFQEIAIKRVSPGKWRRVKRERKIIPQQSVLLVSSKANARSQQRHRALKLSNSADKSATECSTESRSADTSPFDVPYRLAINSSYLLDVLSQLTGERITESRNVFVRPFKYLVAYESDIRQFLKEAEATYDQVISKLSELTQDNPDAVVTVASSTKQLSGDEKIKRKTEKGTHDSLIGDAKKTVSCAGREMNQLRCLVEFMDRDMHDIFDVKHRISNSSLTEIPFEHLWLLYKPGGIILDSKSDEYSGRRQAYRILNIAGGRTYFDSGFKAVYTGIIDQIGDSDSENEEKCRDAIKCSGMDMTCFIIDAFYIDFDGGKLGPRPRRFAIPPYNGTKPISTLAPFPLLPGSESQQIQQSLLERGRRFVKLVPGAHKKYSGSTIQEGNQTTRGYNNWLIKQTELHSEIMIDQAAGVEHFKQRVYRFGRNLKFGGGSIARSTPQDKRETFDALPEQEDGSWVTDVFDDSKFEEDRQNEYRRSTDLLGFRTLLSASVSDDHLTLLPPRVYGYGLLEHKWLPLDINLVEDLLAREDRVNRARFGDLVLPEGHRMILQALIKNQVEQPKASGEHDGTGESFSMDAVPGKGRGLIILLHGAPGVGKTSTAECVAAQLKRPLLPITCGDIGTTAETASQTLESFCALAHRWRCVLLLDEADVFLAKREKGDIIRNSLVSVFLRVLEYYSGVIILTTNRVGEFDEAFRSRIHMSLYYPKLDEISTKEIWEKNIQHIKKSGGDIDIEEDKLRRFANKHWQDNKYKPSRRWNGRQIKNAFQTALALANWDFREGKDSAKLQRPQVKVAHFNRIAQTSAHFDDYISDIHGIQEEDTYGILAEREEVRKDNYEPSPEKQSMHGSRPRKNPPPRRHGISRRNTGALQSRNYGYDDFDNESSEDDIERLKLKLELAKLKKQKGLNDKAESCQVSDDNDEEAW